MDNSDIKVFASDNNESDEETFSVEWSSNLHEINVEELRLPHRPMVDLPDDAKAKDSFDLFMKSCGIQLLMLARTETKTSPQFWRKFQCLWGEIVFTNFLRLACTGIRTIS